MVPLYLRNWTNSGPRKSKKTVSNFLPENAPRKRDLHDTETIVETQSPSQFPFASQWNSSEPNARTLSDNAICHKQLPTLLQRWHPPSPLTFAMWHCNLYCLSRPSCRWDRPWWLCLHGLVSDHQPNFRGLYENGHSIFSMTFRLAVFSVYGHNSAMIRGRFDLFSY